MIGTDLVSSAKSDLVHYTFSWRFSAGSVRLGYSYIQLFAKPQWVFMVMEGLTLPQWQLHKHADLLQSTPPAQISCLAWCSVQRHPKRLSRISLGWPSLLVSVQLQPCLIQNPILSRIFCKSSSHLFFSNSAASLNNLSSFLSLRETSVFALHGGAKRHNFHNARFYRDQEKIPCSPAPPYFLISDRL